MVWTPWGVVGSTLFYTLELVSFILLEGGAFHNKKYRKAEYVQRRVRFVNVQSSLHENVVFSVCAHMCNAAYVIFIMWNSISG